VVRRLTVLSDETPSGAAVTPALRAALAELPPARGDGTTPLPALADAQGRGYSYLRLSVTDRCDLACVYCMPPGGEDEHALRPELLSFEEAARLVSLFVALGVRRVRFTGGEPLVRRDVVRLVELVYRQSGGSAEPGDDAAGSPAALRPPHLAMTTNGTRLAELARPLRDAGLRGVNVSLDTLDAERFRSITRGGELGRVLAGVHAALDAGLEVKINAVALGGLNDHDAPALVDWAWSLGITPRFIELMPLGEAAHLPAERFVSRAGLIERLGSRLSRESVAAAAAHGPARYLAARDGSARKVGFITAVSDEFCASCNRVRVTARGDIRACLASRQAVSLRDLMRAGAGDHELAWAIHAALGTKLAGHFFNDASVAEHMHVGMSLIGG
jgi:cyclic pyranopterin phosphate synthase